MDCAGVNHTDNLFEKRVVEGTAKEITVLQKKMANFH